MISDTNYSSYIASWTCSLPKVVRVLVQALPPAVAYVAAQAAQNCSRCLSTPFNRCQVPRAASAEPRNAAAVSAGSSDGKNNGTMAELTPAVAAERNGEKLNGGLPPPEVLTPNADSSIVDADNETVATDLDTQAEQMAMEAQLLAVESHSKGQVYHKQGGCGCCAGRPNADAVHGPRIQTEVQSAFKEGDPNGSGYISRTFAVRYVCALGNLAKVASRAAYVKTVFDQHVDQTNGLFTKKRLKAVLVDLHRTQETLERK